jgi:hypothetical protein
VKPPSPIVPSRIVSTRATTRKSKVDKAAENEQLIEFVEDVKRQVEPQLRRADHKKSAEEAEVIAAGDYGYTLEAIRRKRTRVRAKRRRS